MSQSNFALTRGRANPSGERRGGEEVGEGGEWLEHGAGGGVVSS